MQVMMTKLKDREILDMLAMDMFERNQKLRHNTIVNQIEDKIVEKWLITVKEKRIWDKPVKCVVRFVENENGSVFEGKPFTLTATLDTYGQFDLEKSGDFFNYINRVRNALTFMRFDLCKHDLDKIEFDTDNETGRESINVFEYHYVTKGF